MADLSEALSGRGFNSPLRFEVSIQDCEVVGQIPKDLDGAFYRDGYEWYYPPKFPDDAILNADGYISSFRFKGGKVDYKGRFVNTHRMQKLREAGHQLYGYYRNPYTDDPAVRDPEHPNLRTLANTNPVVHAGKLFATKEDGPPYQIDPNTLETIGPWDFQGAWKSQTFSAHPKLDPITGEMVGFGYEATGLASDDLFIYTIDRTGKVRHEARVKVPYVSVIHDMALTHRHVVIPFSGYVTSLERLKAGKIHWGWDSTKPGYIGVMGREDSGKGMRWFKGPNRCHMHTFNAYSDGNKVILYAAFWDSNFFPFFPNVDGSPFDPSKAHAVIRKFTLDLDSAADTWQEEVLWDRYVNDLGKVDPRTSTLASRYLYTSFTDAQAPYDRGRAGPHAPATVTNCYGRFDVHTRKVDRYFAGRTHALQECTFVPRGSSEGQGYLVGVASNYAQMRSELIIADAEHLADGDVARVILPFRLSPQVHGIWAGRDQLPLV